MEVSVYFCSDPILSVVPRLIQKILQQDLRVLMLCENDEQLASFDTQIWTFSSKVFLPHGTTKDMWPERQPVLLSTTITDANHPKLLLDIRNESYLDSSADYGTNNFQKIIHILAAGEISEQLQLLTAYHRKSPDQCWVQDELRKWQPWKKD